MAGVTLKKGTSKQDKPAKLNSRNFLGPFSISKVDIPGDQKAFIVIKVGKDTFPGYAPITGISIEQAVNINVAAALSADLWFSSIGDMPVKIGLDGLTLLPHGNCLSSAINGQDGTVMSFYSDNKASYDPSSAKKVELQIISPQSNPVKFKAVIIGMSLEYRGESQNVAAYSMRLIGCAVPKQNKP